MQEVLEGFLAVYRQQQAAIAALETHLHAYGYTAVWPQPVPAEPLATAQHLGEPLPAAESPHGVAGFGSAFRDAGSDDCDAGADPATAKAAAAADAAGPAYLLATTASPPADRTAMRIKPDGTAAAEAVAVAATGSVNGAPLAPLTNLPHIVVEALAGKPPPPASPSGGSSSSGTPFSISPSLRCAHPSSWDPECVHLQHHA